MWSRYALKHHERQMKKDEKKNIASFYTAARASIIGNFVPGRTEINFRPFPPPFRFFLSLFSPSGDEAKFISEWDGRVRTRFLRLTEIKSSSLSLFLQRPLPGCSQGLTSKVFCLFFFFEFLVLCAGNGLRERGVKANWNVFRVQKYINSTPFFIQVSWTEL